MWVLISVLVLERRGWSSFQFPVVRSIHLESFRVRSPGEGNGNPLQYSCLENPVDRGAWWAAVHRVAQSRTGMKWLSMHACIGEENGSPLQCSCLENPRDRGAWWTAVYGVAQRRTRLKRLSSSSNQVVTSLRFVMIALILKTCGWFILMFGRNQCSTVKQLSFN